MDLFRKSVLPRVAQAVQKTPWLAHLQPRLRGHVDFYFYTCVREESVGLIADDDHDDDDSSAHTVR
jgi:hypothetical protein